MPSFKALTVLTLLSIATTSYACDGAWQTNTAGNWSTSFSCMPIVPPDIATFGTPSVGPVAVNLDVNPFYYSYKLSK
jgi:hypothetical protein